MVNKKSPLQIDPGKSPSDGDKREGEVKPGKPGESPTPVFQIMGPLDHLQPDEVQPPSTDSVSTITPLAGTSAVRKMIEDSGSVPNLGSQVEAGEEVELTGGRKIVPVRLISAGEIVPMPGNMEVNDDIDSFQTIVRVSPRDAQRATEILQGYYGVEVMQQGTRSSQESVFLVCRVSSEDMISRAIANLNQAGIVHKSAKVEAKECRYIKIAGKDGQKIEIPLFPADLTYVEIQPDDEEQSDGLSIDESGLRQSLGADVKEMEGPIITLEIALDQFDTNELNRLSNTLNLAGIIEGGKFAVTSTIRREGKVFRPYLAIHGNTEAVSSDFGKLAVLLRQRMLGKGFHIVKSRPSSSGEGMVVCEREPREPGVKSVPGEFLIQRELAEQLKADSIGHGREGQLIRRIKFRESGLEDWVLVHDLDVGLVIRGAETVGEEYKLTEKEYAEMVLKLAQLKKAELIGEVYVEQPMAVMLVGHAGTGKSKHMLPAAIKKIEEATPGPIQMISVSGREGFIETPFQTAIDLFDELYKVYSEIVRANPELEQVDERKGIDSFAALLSGQKLDYFRMKKEHQRNAKIIAFKGMCMHMFKTINAHNNMHDGRCIIVMEDLHNVHNSTSGKIFAQLIREIPIECDRSVVLPTTRPGKHLQAFVYNLLNFAQQPQIQTPLLDFVSARGDVNQEIVAEFVDVTIRELGSSIEYHAVDAESFGVFARMANGIPFVMKGLIENAYNSGAINIKDGVLSLDPHYANTQLHDIGSYDPENDSTNSVAIAKIHANKFEGTQFQNEWEHSMLACIALAGSLKMPEIHELMLEVVGVQVDADLAFMYLRPPGGPGALAHGTEMAQNMDTLNDEQRAIVEAELEAEKREVMGCMLAELSTVDMIKITSTGFGITNPIWLKGIVASLDKDVRLNIALGVLDFCRKKGRRLSEDQEDFIHRVLLEGSDSLEDIDEGIQITFARRTSAKLRDAARNFDYKTLLREGSYMLDTKNVLGRFADTQLEGAQQSQKMSAAMSTLSDALKTAIVSCLTGCAHMRQWDQGLELIERFKPTIEADFAKGGHGLGQIAPSFAKAEQLFRYYYDRRNPMDQYLQDLTAATDRLRELNLATPAIEVREARRYGSRPLPASSRYPGVPGTEAIKKLKQDLIAEARQKPGAAAGIGPNGNPDVNEAIRIITAVESREEYNARLSELDTAEAYAVQDTTGEATKRIKIAQTFLKMIEEGDAGIAPIVEEDLHEMHMQNLAMAGEHAKALELAETHLYNRAFIVNNFAKVTRAVSEMADILTGQILNKTRGQMHFPTVAADVEHVGNLLNDAKGAVETDSHWHEYINGRIIQVYGLGIGLNITDLQSMKKEELKTLAAHVEIVLATYLDSFGRGHFEDDADNMYDMVTIAAHAHRIGMMIALERMLPESDCSHLLELCAAVKSSRPFVNGSDTQARILEKAGEIPKNGPIKNFKVLGARLLAK